MNPEEPAGIAPMRPEFAVHMLNDSGKQKAGGIAEQFSKLLVYLEGVCIDCREFSIAKTKLEEACFFAKKSMLLT